MAPMLLSESESELASSDNVLTGSNNTERKPLCNIITPVGMLGYGFDVQLNRAALQELAWHEAPTAIILDSGSTDSGPDKLALGGMTAPRSSYVRDLRNLLALSHEFHVPVIVGSAGGSGTDAHVDEFLKIIKEISDEEGNSDYYFKALGIYSNVTKARVLKSLASKEVKGCGVFVPELSESDVDNAVEIVAQMGPEPFLDAMMAEPDFDIIIGGRCYDPSPYIAWAVHQAGVQGNLSLKAMTREQLGGFAFMGKLMECGAHCGTPKTSSSQATVYQDGAFDIKPLNTKARCVPHSVAAHSLYEKTRPNPLPGPGGNLVLSKSKYQQLPDGRSVRVTGGDFELSRDHNLPYTVKLEAAKVIGFRSIIMGGIRDPILIKHIDTLTQNAKTYALQQHKDVTSPWEVDFHVYGAHGIMESLEPGDSSYQPREVFLVGEALAPTQELANSIASAARIACMHAPYPGQRGTAGNFAFGIGGKLCIEMGPCTEFCIYHLLPLQNGEEHAAPKQNVDGQSNQQDEPLFSWKAVDIGNAPTTPSTISTPSKSSTTLNLASPLTLCDIAPVIRSKNSGPYEITLDILFSHPAIYELVKTSDLLTRDVIANLYHLADEEIVHFGFYDPALGFKATIPRKRAGRNAISGGFMETDVHGSQQYAGLLGLQLGEELKKGIVGLGLEE
ncbi:hypothetical protein B0O99DRAFT_616612 [Bisporella sp. PMI_857]|nr:hypothetical protein B0O99DRAFT_616612 [Bisporella sp. PMI_857]